MGFWHTGYIEFHEPTGLVDHDAGPPRLVRYACEHCTQDFASLEELRRHRFEVHPLRQPLLLVRGRPVGAIPMLVISPLEDQDVALEDVVRCTINGHFIAPSDLGARLAAARNEYVDLLLSSEGVNTRCVLDFRIAATEHLAGVEMAFERMANDRVLNLDAVSRFIKECRAFASAMPYCQGICHYLYGVMAKERAPDSGLRHDQYSERYQRASEELADFERPLARSIRALVAFHFNHFHDVKSLARDGALKHAAGAFDGLLQGKPWDFETTVLPAGGAVEDLLTDQDTLQVLADASHSLAELKNRVNDLLMHLRRAVHGYDRFKRLLLAAEALAAEGSDASLVEARKLARELVGQPPATAWAEAILGRTRTQ